MKSDVNIWIAALKAYDQKDTFTSLELFARISDTSRILFNVAHIYAEIGEYKSAIRYFEDAAQQDDHLAIAHFQCGVNNFAQKKYKRAVQDFKLAHLCLRGAPYINYQTLGLNYWLYAAEVLFNQGICHLRMGDVREGLGFLSDAQSLKASPDHDLIDSALRDVGKGYRMFSLPFGILYRPPGKLPSMAPLSSEEKARRTTERETMVGYLGMKELVPKSKETTTLGVKMDKGRSEDPYPFVTPVHFNRTKGHLPLNPKNTGLLGSGPGSTLFLKGPTPKPQVENERRNDSYESPKNSSYNGSHGPSRLNLIQYGEEESTDLYKKGFPNMRSKELQQDSTSESKLNQTTRPPLSPSLSVLHQKLTIDHRKSIGEVTDIYNDYYEDEDDNKHESDEYSCYDGYVDDYFYAQDRSPATPDPTHRVRDWAAKSTQQNLPLTNTWFNMEQSQRDSIYSMDAPSRPGSPWVGLGDEAGSSRYGSSLGSGSHRSTGIPPLKSEESRKIKVKIRSKGEIRGMIIPQDLELDVFKYRVAEKFGKSKDEADLVWMKFIDDEGAAVWLRDDADWDYAVELASLRKDGALAIHLVK